MKRPLLYTLLTVGLLFALTACGGDTPQNTPGQQSVPPTGQEDSPSSGSEQFTFTSNDFTVSIDQNMEEVLGGLGKELSYFEAASCAFDGLDKTYTYSGFTITTRPEEDGDFVNSIFLTDDSTTTEEGIYIGSTREEVAAAYGESAQTGNVMSYTKGNTTLNFILENDKVISIEYLPTGPAPML